MNLLVVVLVIGALLGFGFGFIVGDAHGYIDGQKEVLELVMKEQKKRAPFVRTKAR